MKLKIRMIVSAALAMVMVSCNADYKKTKSGIVYKIFPGDGKDSVARLNDIVKFNHVYKINDSLLVDSHGKMPGFFVVSPQVVGSYSEFEVFTQVRKGDSLVVTLLVDTLLKKGQQIPFAKKGDQIKAYFKILEVFRADSIARKDYEAELAKEQAGQKVKEEKELQDYFAAKKISPVRAPRGTYVVINEKGSGVPAALGKFLTVKYAGRTLVGDKPFDAGVYVFQLGPGNAIQGWHDGLALFNKGGKGVLYVPGSLAYGPSPQGPGGPNSALIFDVEILNVSDTQEQADATKRITDSLTAKNLPKTNQ